MTITNISMLEKQLLSAYCREKDIVLAPQNYFLSDIGHEFFNVIQSLSDEGYQITKEHILQKVSDKITTDIVDTLLTGIEYQADKIKDYQQALKEVYYVDAMRDELETLSKETARHELNYEKISEVLNTLDEYRSEIHADNSTLQYFTNYMADHRPILEDRMKSNTTQSSGCYLLDSILPAKSLFAGLSFIYGQPASGKTTITDYFLVQRFLKKLPTVSINLELSHEVKKDNFICTLCELDYFEVKGVASESGLLEQYVMDKYDEMQKRFERNKKFMIETEQQLSIYDIPAIIKQARKEMGLDDNTILFMCIDLFTMLKEFNMSKNGQNQAGVIDQALNYLNAQSLKLNTFLLGVIQPKRPKDKVSIKELEDLEKLRPTIEEIKGSGGFQERARFIMAIHNPKQQALKYLSDTPVGDALEPVIEIQSLKDNIGGSTGRIIKYLHIGNTRKIRPYFEDDAERLAFHKKYGG